MTHREQTKYIDILKKYEKKMETKEAEIFKMLVKRHRDDEDLDRLSGQKLVDLYNKYHVNRDKTNLDKCFSHKSTDSSNTED